MTRIQTRMPTRVPTVVGAAAVLVGAVAAGYVLATVAAAFDSDAPVVLAGLGLVPAAAILLMRRPWLAPAVVFLVFPVGFTRVPGAPVQLIQVAVLAVAVFVALRRLTDGRSPLPWTPPLTWVLLLLAWSLVSLPSAADQELAVRQVAALAGGLLFTCVVMGALERWGDVRLVAASLVAVAAAVAASTPASSEQASSAFGGALVEGRAIGFFTHANQLGSFCVMALFVAVGLAFGLRRPARRLLAFAAVAVITVALLLSLARGAWIGFAVGTVVLYAMLPAARRALLRLVPVAIVAAFVIGAFASSNPQVQVIGERLGSLTGEQNPYDNRPTIWREAVREIRADPWTGQGPGAFPVASTRSVSRSSTVSAEHAHNVLLTWAAENGLPAVALVIAVTLHVAVLVWRTSRRLRRHGRTAELALLSGGAAALAAMVGQGLVDYTLRSSVILVELFGVLGLVLGVLALTEGSRSRPRVHSVRKPDAMYSRTQ